ncbi:hypothetical protein WH47_11033 [Habropoda laboriosa]|uniref:Mos1 transposase HTH domain-containing protein n=1 Tax=Habropoda laboriosa TaxID=597456 RepID=A0A0L7QLH9_9HYME|nr:hypothetical protein WH47_11033 [Habropoda laboriosa]
MGKLVKMYSNAFKNVIYQEIPTTPKNMGQRITAVCAEINSETIRCARDSTIQKLQVCIDANGQHFKHLL